MAPIKGVYTMTDNPLNLLGIDFVEWSSSDPDALHLLFTDFGFTRVGEQPGAQARVARSGSIDLYQQNQIKFHVNRVQKSFADHFQKLHGPSICAMGWKFDHAQLAFEKAVMRGARPCLEGDYFGANGKRIPAIYGIGESLIYFVDEHTNLGFNPVSALRSVPDKGFLCIDHLTNNVYKGTMDEWAAFYKDVFGFTEVRYFDIKGQKTGLTSYALRSPCGTFCIPINEANESKSQINEYLDEYKGPGIQHLAFLTRDLLGSLRKLKGTGIKMLDIGPGYYDRAFTKVPWIKEDKTEIQKLNVLVDGDPKGYLLQIFTKNLVGPIFVELIQRENHLSFGEGNFQALFDSIERDQMMRGVL